MKAPPPGTGPERVAVAVLNYNGADDTLACLRSLAALERAPGTVRVVDNASADDSVERIRSEFPAVDVSVNAANLGFGEGLNPTLARLLDEGWPWIWLVNNDARAEPDALERLIEHARRHPDAGALGCRVVEADPPHAVQSWGGGRIGWWRGNTRHLIDPAHGSRLDYITGASMLLRADALREIGLFDPRFFVYWEDVDLCLRLRAAGWRLAVAPDAVVHHRLSSTAGSETHAKDALINASAVRFFRKHGRLGGWPAIVVGVSGRIAKRALRGDLAAAAAVWRGALEGLSAPAPRAVGPA